MTSEACSPGRWIEQDSGSAAILKDGLVVGKSSNNNISLRTGEEFSMEFLQDRGAKRIPNGYDMDQNHRTVVGSKSNVNGHIGYKELNGMLGSQRDSVCNSSSADIISAKGPPVINSIPSLSHRASGSGVSDDSQRGKIKFLCSSGGKILHRPSDGKLRYVGGETRIFSIQKNMLFDELVKRTSEFCNQPHTIKYQLPGEDLDALISVSSNEDLQNMIEEYNGLGSREGSPRLRIFLIPLTECESTITIEANASLQNNPDYLYVAAVNGIVDDSPLRNNDPQFLANDISQSNPLENNVPQDARLNGHAQMYNDPLSDSIEIPILKGRAFHSENRILHPSDQVKQYVGPNGSHLGIPHAVSDPQLQELGATSAFGSQDGSNLPSTLSFALPLLPSQLAPSVLQGKPVEQLDNNMPNVIPELRSFDGTPCIGAGMVAPNVSSSVAYSGTDILQRVIGSESLSRVHEDAMGINEDVKEHLNKNAGKLIDDNFNYPSRKAANLGHEERHDKVRKEIPSSSKDREQKQVELNDLLGDVSNTTSRSKMLGAVNTEALPSSATEAEHTLSDSSIKDAAMNNGDQDVPFNNALIAEMEADIYGLQIIKNAELEELRELGSGTYGTVYHGRWRGSDVAIKRIKKSCFSGRSSEQERLTNDFWREARILSNLHHPNVVAFYGVVPDGSGGTLATITEFMTHGSLRNVLIKKDRSLDRRRKLIIAMDAAFGMEYLHLKNIVHFDLKCDNLLVNMRDPQRPICKVGDFGLSRIKRNTLVSGGVRGTLPWMAPELLNGSTTRVSEKVDVFSFGITMWEILTGEEPYANMHCGAIIGGIVKDTLRPTIPERCDPEWRKLMEQCWSADPVIRPSFTEITNRLRVMSKAPQPNGLGTTQHV
ncbi:uncharacterized protein LOC112518351 isoform X3 [Cynara cardunculus var. scolymus]|uniref:uncharacterized protein LOC112518351 isoform X3 n=1 Tax=Cynara cardunculus var. scolymus TaxID=59895 RepID=UPI000D628B1A|nr:uncharacterized protein LOC112518351 isoform X3 [Cynara cardunculus var. scolymus]